MNLEQHKARHEELHRSLDELLADFLDQKRGHYLRNTSMMEFLTWSYLQTQAPTGDPEHDTHVPVAIFAVTLEKISDEDLVPSIHEWGMMGISYEIRLRLLNSIIQLAQKMRERG